MSNTKMLIDATHPEETRVVVQRNGRVEEFDFESAARKLLRGNIYLAKVTRVEPSLQAAFVDYGGNRHGFLAFNEIHPDYYQIPVADRLALIEEEAAAEAELEAAADRRAEALARRAENRSRRRSGGDGGPSAASSEAGDTDHDAVAADDGYHDDDHHDDDQSHDEDGSEASHIIDVEEDEHIEEIGGDESDDDAPPKNRAAAVDDRDDVISEEPSTEAAARADEQRELASLPSNDIAPAAPHHHEAEDDEDAPEADSDADADSEADADDAQSADAAEATEEITSDGTETEQAHHDDAIGDVAEVQTRGRNGRDFHDEAPQRPRRRPRSYKIQEVIKRRQVILVQVVKEERGNKGAALTTYLSLAGRYTVLMPNTARGGGISRKITNPQDRKRLKAIANELDVPEGMGLIIRTAGAARTKQEIKRDFEYLLRLWESVRDLTLQSTAPSLVYEEGDLVKRSIRDLYNKDVEEVVVAGDEGYEEANAFMRMLMPSHARNVVRYKGATPLFTSYGVERQLNAMFQPQVTLRSGGYIVINQTEALVAIDVNSGKSTREFSIEETALATNLEAADEIARQLKLRDLAGLIVIDFIDMEEKRNNRAVERRLKDALRHDRARIQLGRISHFGLMEMSRQRLRTGVLEGSTSQCAHCQGTGIIRSTESIALAVLRGLEDAITAGANTPLIATTTPAVALYILNSKRAYIADMEARHGFSVTIIGNERIQGANFTVERGTAAPQTSRRPERAAVNMDWGFEGEDAELGASAGEGPTEAIDDVNGRSARTDGEEENGGRRRRRRRRGRGRRSERMDDGERLDSQSDMDDAGSDADETGDDQSDITIIDEAGESATDTAAEGADQPGRTSRRRRRGRRGGRRSRETGPHSADADAIDAAAQGDDDQGPDVAANENDIDGADDENVDAADASDTPNADKPKSNERKPSRRRERLWDTADATRGSEETDAAIDSNAAEAVNVDTVVSDQDRGQARDHNGNGDDHNPVGVSEVMEAVAEATPVRRRHETDSTEPRLERVVVTPDENGSMLNDQEPPAQRKGWWQRRFGSE